MVFYFLIIGNGVRSGERWEEEELHRAQGRWCVSSYLGYSDGFLCQKLSNYNFKYMRFFHINLNKAVKNKQNHLYFLKKGMGLWSSEFLPSWNGFLGLAWGLPRGDSTVCGCKTLPFPSPQRGSSVRVKVLIRAREVNFWRTKFNYFYS